MNAGGPAMVLAAVLFAIGAPGAVAAQNSPKDSPSNPRKELFNQHCASCHFAETAAQKIGPGLKGLYVRLTFSDGKKVTDASVTRWIEEGGKNMPGFKETMKPEQIRVLIFYLKTL